MRVLTKHTDTKGGTLIEYTLITVFATMAVSAMAMYLSRGIATVQTNIEETAIKY